MSSCWHHNSTWGDGNSTGNHARGNASAMASGYRFGSSSFNSSQPNVNCSSPSLDNDTSHRSYYRGQQPWSVAPDVSYLVATCYISFLTFMALIMVMRSRTPLRLIACGCTVLGLSIAILGFLQNQVSFPRNWFWLWNFFAETVGVVALTFTIVTVGNGFYPISCRRSVLWKLSMCLIVLYGIVATAHIIGYLQQKVIHRKISGHEFSLLREEVLILGMRTEAQQEQSECWAQCLNGLPPGNMSVTGVDNWTQLPRTMKEVFFRPLQWAYVTNQLLMVFTIAWASVYLFVPLLIHHRNRPDLVDRPIDSDMMAIGVWYLSCVMLLTLACTIQNIYYCFQKELIFEQQAQALDLCIRVTLGPIFFLPAPSFLIRFYRERFKKTGSTVGWSPRYGRREDMVGRRTAGSTGSFTTLEELEDTGSCSGPTLEMGPGVSNGATLEAVIAAASNNSSDSNHHRSQKHLSSGSLYDRMKGFQGRNRDGSMESNKVFNQDFDLGDHPDYHHTTDDEVHHSNIEVPRVRTRSELSTYQIPASHFSNDPVLEKQQEPSVSLAGFVPSAPEVQRPQPAWIAMKNWSKDVAPVPPEMEKTGDTTKEIIERELSVPTEKGERSSMADLTGTTGWEMGGWGHTRETSEGNEVSLAYPLEQPYPSLAPSPSPLPLPTSQPRRKGRPMSLDSVFDDDIDLESDPVNIPVEQLTGLQRQLAEHRSALLPTVMAMRDLAVRGPPSVTCDSQDQEEEDEKTANNGRPLPKPETAATEEKGVRFRAATDAPPSPRQPVPRMTDTIREVESYPEMYPLPPTHTVPVQSWGKAAKIPKAEGAKAAAAAAAASGGQTAAHAQTEKSGFRKWLPGRKATDAPFPEPVTGSPKKFDNNSSTTPAVTSPSVVAQDTKGNKNSGHSSANSEITPTSTKNPKSKEGRMGVFKTLGHHRHGEKGRTSQDLNENEHGKDHHADSSNKTDSAKTMASAGPKVPVSVEALAKASAMTNIEEVDESDKGLQYYYPDPYSTLAEFKKPLTKGANQMAAAMDRPVSNGSSRLPLSATPFSEDKLFKSSGSVICTDSPMLDYTLNKNARPSSSATPLTMAPSTGNKPTQGPKKMTKAEALLQGALLGSGSSVLSTSKLISSPLPEPPKDSSASIMSRSSSGSKKFGKIKSRNSRSKSDATSGFTGTSSSTQAMERPSTDSMMSMMSTSSAMTTTLPITATRQPSVPAAPALPQPAQMSLSPPPRQGWARSKSFQGTTSSALAVLMQKSPAPVVPGTNMSIDTNLANQHKSSSSSGQKSNNDAPPSSSSETRSSRDSSQGSPTTATSFTYEGILTSVQQQQLLSSPPLSPPTTASSTTSSSASLTRLGGLKPRLSVDPRNNSLDRESEASRLMLLGKDRTAFSTAAMDMRRASNRHQRSVDNLASAYYYKRAAELNGPAVGAPRNGSTSTTGTQQQPPPPQSPSPSPSTPSSTSQIQTGFSYYGIGVTGGGDSGRNSPSPPNLMHYTGPSSHTVPSLASSSSASTQASGSVTGSSGSGPGLSGGVGSFYYQKKHEAGKSSVDYPTPGTTAPGIVMMPGGGPLPTTSAASTPATGGRAGSGTGGFVGGTAMTASLSGSRGMSSMDEHQGRTGSLTKNSSRRITTEDDPWTSAMIARAQQQQQQQQQQLAKSSTPLQDALGHDYSRDNVDRFSNYSQLSQQIQPQENGSRSLSPGPILDVPGSNINGVGEGFEFGASSYGMSHHHHRQQQQQ